MTKAFGFLSTLDNPLLPFYLKAAVKRGVSNIVVFFDSKTTSSKDLAIWRQRTGGYFEEKALTIYDFSKYHIPFYFIDHNSPDFIALLRALDIYCLFNGGTPRKITKTVLESTDVGVVNVHPGVLPCYRGCSAVEWAIHNDDKVGNTAHIMTEGYDEGPVLEIETYTFPIGSSYQQIRTHIYRKSCDLAARVMQRIQSVPKVELELTKQDESLAKYWKPIPNESMEVVLNKVALGEYRYLEF